MPQRMYKVGEVARLAGVSVRTLHYYDEIGLLVPSGRSAAGYRLYGPSDLLRLQQIAIGRTLGLDLEQIKRQLDDPGFDLERALIDQRERIEARIENARAMLRAIDEALASLKPPRRGIDFAALFDGFDPAEYDEEVRERWGGTDAYEISARRTRDYDEATWRQIKREAEEILQAFADAMRAGAPADAPSSVALAERYRRHIDRWFYPCSPTMHAQLATLYTSDARFERTFERVAAGLAAYVAEAIGHNAER